MKKTNKNVRLSKDVVPQKYTILLKPNIETFIFEGEETIALTLLRPTKSITLHAHELSITKVVIKNENQEIRAKVRFDKKNETATFLFDKTIPSGKWNISLHFAGELNDKLRGFYRSKYLHNGVEKYIATTQFEATDARKAFPCFDEPSLKAVFEVSFLIPKHLTAISNTIDSQVAEHETGYKLVQFEKSPLMSTYLLAFIVGEFEYIEKKTDEGVRVRVFVTPGKKKQAEFALEVAGKALSFYSKYFGIAYPLPVLDMIAIPDFASGAMENWGAVTYRESTLLVDSLHTSTANKQWVALVIAHELAHMWFGNLVTMQWWTHLWLNEGFASYIEYLAIDHIFPEWDIWTQFVGTEIGVALKLDSLANTHPIEVEVHHPHEIGEIFDKVSYSKGASVIRMLSLYLGEKDFQKGLQHYLQKHAYSNAKTEDLWNAFEHVSKKPVAKVMNYWTGKSGYPMVTIAQKKGSLELSQQRYLSSSISKKKVKDTTCWQIPFSLNRNGTVLSPFLFTTRKKVIPLKGKNEYIKGNAQEASFIRVLYDAELYTKLKQALLEKKLDTIDRLGIIRDAFDASESGDVSSTYALDLAMHYKEEKDFTVWSQIISGISQLDLLFSHEPWYGKFQEFQKNLLKDIALKVGWQKKPGETHTQVMLRSIVLYQLGKAGDEIVLQKVTQLFKQHLSGKTLDADLRSVVYALMAKKSDGVLQNYFFKQYDKEELQQEKDRIARALSNFDDPELLQATLEWSISEKVRSQDSLRILGEVMRNPKGSTIALDFVSKYFDIYVKRYSGGGHMFSRFVGLFGDYTREKDAKTIRALFETHKTSEAKRTRDQVLEQIYSNAAWIARDSKKIQDFLESY